SIIPCIVGSPAVGSGHSFLLRPPLSKICQAGNANGLSAALAQHQPVHLLPELNLAARVGATGALLRRGVAPTTDGQENGSITIEFKQYGISLAFVPTVLAKERISLHVRPEVSELTDQGAVRLQEGNSSLVIPALTVRRAETTVEVGSGQSFAIAG